MVSSGGEAPRCCGGDGGRCTAGGNLAGIVVARLPATAPTKAAAARSAAAWGLGARLLPLLPPSLLLLPSASHESPLCDRRPSSGSSAELQVASKGSAA